MLMSDEEVTLGSAKTLVATFCGQRDWDRYHGPKDLAIGISTEASELLEIFRFKSESEVARLVKNSGARGRMGEELADVLYFVLRFAQMYEFDLSDELKNKLTLNETKYPVSRSKGSNKKYTELNGA